MELIMLGQHIVLDIRLYRKVSFSWMNYFVQIRHNYFLFFYLIDSEHQIYFINVLGVLLLGINEGKMVEKLSESNQLVPEKQKRVVGNKHLKQSTFFNFDQLKLKEIVSRTKII